MLEESLNFVNTKYKSDILAYVLMPNHLHFIVFFKEENRLSDYMRDFKKFTSTMIRKALDVPANQELMNSLRLEAKGRAFQIWQDRFDDVYLVGRHLLETKMDYIHNNPLQER